MPSSHVSRCFAVYSTVFWLGTCFLDGLGMAWRFGGGHAAIGKARSGMLPSQLVNLTGFSTDRCGYRRSREWNRWCKVIP